MDKQDKMCNKVNYLFSKHTHWLPTHLFYYAAVQKPKKQKNQTHKRGIYLQAVISQEQNIWANVPF